jgi:hypothetical protein
MTKPKDFAKLTAQLEYCREELHIRNQIRDVVTGLLVTIISITIVDCIFTLAITGANATFVYPWDRILGLLLWAGFMMWILFYCPFSCYYPIMDDAAKGITQILTKLKAAIDAWRKA